MNTTSTTSLDTASTIDEAVIISSLHKALNSFPVMCYNGAEEATEKMLPQAITSISLDVRNVKRQLNSQAELLTGLKKRKAIRETFFGFWRNVSDYLKVRKVLTIISILGGAFISIEGIIHIISILF